MAIIIRWTVRGLILLALILGGNEIIQHVTSWLDLTLMPHTEEMLHRAIMIGLIVYIILMAVPFVPGVEIGLTLLATLGGAIAPLVYLATGVSLMMAYLVGRLLPPEVLQKALIAIGLRRAADFVDRSARMTDDDLRSLLAKPNSPRILRDVLRFRYVALAVAIMAPGNVLLGGGGGIAMMAGLSRLFTPLPFLLTILLAVLPVPLLFYLGAS